MIPLRGKVGGEMSKVSIAISLQEKYDLFNPKPWK